MHKYVNKCNINKIIICFTNSATQLRNWHMVAAASGLTGVLFLSICVISGVIIRRKSGSYNTVCVTVKYDSTYLLISAMYIMNVMCSSHLTVKND